MTASPGLVILFGSGETSPSGRKVFDSVLQRLPQRPCVGILETPAGFQPNSARVAGQIADFLQRHLRNYQPKTIVVPARKRGTAFSPDDPDIAESLCAADLIFLGPGSPTYAVRQLRDSPTWRMLQGRHRSGAVIVFASAATIAAGALALPVYEIYKVGEDIHWQPGLDFFAPDGLSPIFVPHWNNQEGGAELDTSHCYMGRERFAALQALLPADTVCVGIDEHTALIVDLAAGIGHVQGLGAVIVMRDGIRAIFAAGATFPLSELGPIRIPDPASKRPPAVKALTEIPQQHDCVSPPPVVWGIVRERETARQQRDWVMADSLRAKVLSKGWEIRDTPAGPELASVHPTENWRE